MKKNISFIVITVILILVIIYLNIDKNSNDLSPYKNSQTYKRLKNVVDEIWLVDTHEHLMMEVGRHETKIDFFYLFPHYASSDLVSSGMNSDDLQYIRNPENPLSERWNKFEPYWQKMRNTAYAKCLIIAVKDLFSIDDINEGTYKEINKKLIESNKEGWYKYVLKEKAKIDVSILDVLERYSKGVENITGEYFVRVKRFDNFIRINPKNLSSIKDYTKTSISKLDDLILALDIAFKKAIEEEKIIGVKSGLAYSRTLRYDDVPKSEAESVFNKIFVVKKTVSDEELKKLEDFMMHQVIQHAIKYNLPIQIHTGLQEGNGNVITNSNPTHLVNLFLKYRDAKFDIFHGSYPYMGELATLAKNFPNVYLDMCWMHIISPSSSKRWLEEWLETVPSNKILAFGGDFIIVEGAYGHAKMARENVAEVLAKKVDEGYFSEDEATVIAKRILRDNALELFGLKKTGSIFVKSN
jgi:predicted TIM-barrel fold metal-dependent hydrolase